MLIKVVYLQLVEFTQWETLFSDWITSNPSVEYLVCRLNGDGIDSGVNNISSGEQLAIEVGSALNLSRTNDVTLSADNRLAQLLFNNFQDQVNKLLLSIWSS